MAVSYTIGIATESDTALAVGLTRDLNNTPLPASANSDIDVNLGNVPQIDDPVRAEQVYEALLVIHSAIEALQNGIKQLHP